MEAQVFPLGFGRRTLWSFKMDSIKNTTEETIVNIKKTGWVKFFAAAVVLELVLCGTDLRKADAADWQDENKMIVISTNAGPPYSYFEGNEHIGFEVELWKEIAARTGLSVQLETAGFSGLFGALDSGRVDAVSCFMGITPQRQEKFDFSVPYAVDPLGFFVAENSPIQSVEELEGKTIAVENGAQGQLELNALIERGRKYTPRVYEDVSGIMDASIGRVDAHLSSVADENYTMRKMGISLRQLPGNLSEREVGIAFRKNDAAMASRIERVNKAIGAMLADGTIGRLTEKWLGVDLSIKKGQ